MVLMLRVAHWQGLVGCVCRLLYWLLTSYVVGGLPIKPWSLQLGQAAVVQGSNGFKSCASTRSGRPYGVVGHLHSWAIWYVILTAPPHLVSPAGVPPSDDRGDGGQAAQGH
jgi:hypothetical protein